MLDFTYLFEEQVFGDSKLEIFEKYGTYCEISDFARLLGGLVSTCKYSIEGKNVNTGCWWLGTPFDNKARVVNMKGNNFYDYTYERNVGGRPALPYSLIKDISQNAVRGVSGVLEVEYGEYPQTIVDECFSEHLENFFNWGTLNVSRKRYTTDRIELDGYSIFFRGRGFCEYVYDGNKYIRIIADNKCDGKVLSDGRKIKKGNVYWVKVEPIKWIVDEEENIAVAKQILFSGVQFKRGCNYTGDLEKTDLKRFTNNYFAREIIPSNILEKNEEGKKSNMKKYNQYNFDFKKVSEEEIIKGAIESDVAVYLHGRSSEGKSSRVKQLDPDCEIVYLVSASFDSINGKSVYNQDTKEMIDIAPTWYQNLVKKCEEEPNKIHIVFFDELANADRSIRKSIFNLILDKEVNGKWKLPSNARIAAAGNEMEDSSVAEYLPEPLFNRFAHVYIYTSVEAWLSWAMTDNSSYQRLDYEKKRRKYKIHPAIYSFIRCRGESALRSKYDGKKPNADPRKWELASKILEVTNQPEMIRALVGKEITADFVSFCNQNVITLEDVLNDNYDESDLEMDYSKKAATVMGLAYVDFENLEKVRNFTKKLGPASCAQFDNLWVNGDMERLEQIAFLQLKDNEKGGVKR